MKRARSPPAQGSFGCPETLTRDVRETESVTPPCLTRPGAQSCSQLPLASAAAGLPTSNHPTVVEDAVGGEDLGSAAEAASSKRRRPWVGGKRHREDSLRPLAEAHIGRSVHATEPAEELARNVGGRTFVDVQEAGQPCGQRAVPPGKACEGAAAESVYETDTGETDDRTGRQWLTQQQAVEEFCLSIHTLRDAASEGLLKVEKRPNPHGATYAPMRLYQRCELHRLACQIWGDEIGVEKERERRREQRWQQRQQRTPSVLCESATLAAGSTGAGTRSRRSLPDLRTFLRSSSKRKRETTKHNVVGSMRCTAAVHPAVRETSEPRSTCQKQWGQQAASHGQCRTAEKTSAATRASVGSEERNARSVEEKALKHPGDVRAHAHSLNSQEIVWEEI